MTYPKTGRGHSSQTRRGVAAVEFAFIAPIMIALVFGIWEIGRMVQVMQVLENAAREGARQASTATASLTDIKANVQSYITNAEPGVTNINGYDLRYSNITHSSVSDPQNATQLDRFTIQVVLPFDNVRMFMPSFIVPQGTNLVATVDWYSMRDLPVTVTTGLPVE
jgi:Flp pilus assembly protein TadG